MPADRPIWTACGTAGEFTAASFRTGSSGPITEVVSTPSNRPASWSGQLTRTLNRGSPPLHLGLLPYLSLPINTVKGRSRNLCHSWGRHSDAFMASQWRLPQSARLFKSTLPWRLMHWPSLSNCSPPPTRVDSLSSSLGAIQYYVLFYSLFLKIQYVIKGNGYLPQRWDFFWAANGDLLNVVFPIQWGTGWTGMFNLTSMKIDTGLSSAENTWQTVRGQEVINVPSTVSAIFLDFWGSDPRPPRNRTQARMCFSNVHMAEMALVCKYLWLYLWKLI